MKTQDYIPRILAIFLILTSCYSCEKFYNPDLETRLPADENFSDYLSSRASVNGLYALMQDLMDAYVVNGELKADMLTITADANEDLADIFNLKFSTSNSYMDILPFYTLITNANDVILHLEEEMEKGTSYGDELNNMYAEAVVIRAWTYFYLVRNYTQVPYLTEDFTATDATGTIDEWLSASSGTYASVDDLISSTEDVLSYLIPTYYTNSQFFNIASANAFLGEMYLWNNDYQESVDALLESATAADKYRFILDSDLENAKWQNIFKGDESAADEIMTKIIYDKGEHQENTLNDLFSSISPEGPQLLPVEETMTSLEGSYRYDGTFKNSSEVGKYTRSLDKPYTSDMPVILYRAADVHLMLAEAYNRLGEFDVALDLVNNGNDSLFTAFSKGVRGRLKLDPIKVSGANLQDSIIDLENKIIEERACELAFEGKRWYDLVRIANRRNDPGFIVEKMAKKYSDMNPSDIEDFYGNPDNYYNHLDY